MKFPVTIQQKYIPKDGKAVPYLHITVNQDMQVKIGQIIALSPTEPDAMYVVDQPIVDEPYWTK